MEPKSTISINNVEVTYSYQRFKSGHIAYIIGTYPKEIKDRFKSFMQNKHGNSLFFNY